MRLRLHLKNFNDILYIQYIVRDGELSDAKVNCIVKKEDAVLVSFFFNVPNAELIKVKLGY